MMVAMPAFAPFFATVPENCRPDYKQPHRNADQQEDAQKDEPIRLNAIRSNKKLAYHSPGPEGAASALSPAIFMFNFCIRY